MTERGRDPPGIDPEQVITAVRAPRPDHVRQRPGCG
jgi:hypothetical protein